MVNRWPDHLGDNVAETDGELLGRYQSLLLQINLQTGRNPNVLTAFARDFEGFNDLKAAYTRTPVRIVLEALVDAATNLFEKIEKALDLSEKTDDFERYKRIIDEKIREIRRLGDVESEICEIERELAVISKLAEGDLEGAFSQIVLLQSRVLALYWRVRPKKGDVTVESEGRTNRDLRPEEFQRGVIADGAREGEKFSVRILKQMEKDGFLRISSVDAQKHLEEKSAECCMFKYFVVFEIVNPDPEEGGEPVFYFVREYNKLEEIPTALPAKCRGKVNAFVNRKLVDRGDADSKERIRNNLFPLVLSVVDAGEEQYSYWRIATGSVPLDEQYLYFHERGFLPVNSDVVRHWMQDETIALPWGNFVVLYGIKLQDSGDRLFHFCKFIDHESELRQLKTSDQLVGPRVFAIQQFMDLVGGGERTQNILKDFSQGASGENRRESKRRILSQKLRQDSWVPTSKELVDFWKAQRETDVKSGFLNVLTITVPGETEPIFFSNYSSFPLEVPDLEGASISADWYRIVPYVSGGGRIINSLMPLDFAGRGMQYKVENWAEAAQLVMAKAKYMKAYQGAEDAWAKPRAFPYEVSKFWIALIHTPGQDIPVYMYFSPWQDPEDLKLPEGICGKILEYDVHDNDGRHSLDSDSARTVFESSDLGLTADIDQLLRVNKIDGALGEGVLDEGVGAEGALPPGVNSESPGASEVVQGGQRLVGTQTETVPAELRAPDQANDESVRKVSVRGQVFWICAGVASAALLATGLALTWRDMDGASPDDEGTFARSSGAAVTDSGRINVDASRPDAVLDASLPDVMTLDVSVPDIAVPDPTVPDALVPDPVRPPLVSENGPHQLSFEILDQGIQRTLRQGLEEELKSVAGDLNSWQLREEVRDAVGEFALQSRRLGNPLEDDVKPGEKLDVQYRWDGSSSTLIIEDVDLRSVELTDQKIEKAPDQEKSTAEAPEKSSVLDLNSLNSGDLVLYTPHPKKGQKFAPEPRPRIVVGPSKSTPPGIILKNPGTNTEFAVSEERAKQSIKLLKQSEHKKFAVVPVKDNQERIYFAEKDGGIESLLVNYFTGSKGLDRPAALLQAKKLLAKSKNVPDLKVGPDGEPVAVYKSLWNLNAVHVGDSIVVEEVDGEYRVVALDKQWPKKLTL